MIIAISQRVIKTPQGDRDALDQAYVSYFAELGISLLCVPNTHPHLEAFLSQFDVRGVILSGGNDIDPGFYGDAPTHSKDYSAARDQTEKSLLDYALRKRLPVLGICRGAQFLNAYFGGKLTQDLRQDNLHSQEHVGTEHLVTFDPALHGFARAKVNSYHSQGILISQLSPQVQAFARCDDGTVEGLFHPALPIAGILWHPERKSTEQKISDTLVRDFINKSGFWEIKT